MSEEALELAGTGFLPMGFDDSATSSPFDAILLRILLRFEEASALSSKSWKKGQIQV